MYGKIFFDRLKTGETVNLVSKKGGDNGNLVVFKDQKNDKLKATNTSKSNIADPFQQFIFKQSNQFPSYYLIYNKKIDKYLSSTNTFYGVRFRKVTKDQADKYIDQLEKLGSKRDSFPLFDDLLWKIVISGGFAYFLNKSTKGYLTVRGVESFNTIDKLVWTRGTSLSGAKIDYTAKFTVSFVNQLPETTSNTSFTPSKAKLEKKLLKFFEDLYAKKSSNYDLVLKIGKEEFQTHEFVVCTRSTFLRKCLEKEKKNWKKGEVHSLRIEDYAKEILPLNHKLFEVVLKYFYTGDLKLKSTNVLDVSGYCNELKMEIEKEECASYIERKINPRNILGLFFSAKAANNKEVINHCTRVIEENIELVSENELFYDLPLDFMLENVLKNESLNCDEKGLFDLILQWYCANKDKVCPGSKEKQDKFLVEKFIPYIRFGVMKIQDLEVIERMNFVDEDLLLDAYRYISCKQFDENSVSIEEKQNFRNNERKQKFNRKYANVVLNY